jgi:hypothetical protein
MPKKRVGYGTREGKSERHFILVKHIARLVQLPRHFAVMHMVPQAVGKLLSVGLFLEIKTNITNIYKSPDKKNIMAKNQVKFEVFTAVTVKIYSTLACDW